MANHYTEFSFQLEDLTATEIASLREAEAEVKATSDDPGTFYSPLQQIDPEKGTAHFASVDTLDPDDAARIIQAFLKRERPGDVVAFTAAGHADRAILGAFTGTGYVVQAGQIDVYHVGSAWAERMEDEVTLGEDAPALKPFTLR